MATYKLTNDEYCCSYCMAEGKTGPECKHDVNRTTGGCWSGSHDKCRGKCFSGIYGTVDCACPCHGASPEEIQQAIDSIVNTVNGRK